MPTLLLALALAGCGVARDVDRTLRRVEMLDRVFEPDRFRPEPIRPPEPPPPAMPEPVVEAAGPPPVEAAPEPEPPSRPAVRDPAQRVRYLVRENPWVARFWSELTPPQQARVRRRVGPGADAAASWDRMGLDDRVVLLFGG